MLPKIIGLIFLFSLSSACQTTISGGVTISGGATISGPLAGGGVAGCTGLCATAFGSQWSTNSVSTPPKNNPWPVDNENKYGSFRIWQSVARWSNLQTAADTSTVLSPTDSVFNWANLDAQLNNNKSLGNPPSDYVYTGGSTPSFAGATTTTIPTDATGTCTVNISAAFVSYAGLTAGDCFWQEFVFAIAEHVNPSYNASTCTASDFSGCLGTLNIKYWVPWNEPNISSNGKWCSTTLSSTSGCTALSKMSIDMARIIHAIDPTAQVSTPEFTASTSTSSNWTDMQYFLSHDFGYGLVGDFMDILNFHSYCNGYTQNGAGVPESANCTNLFSTYTSMASSPTYHMNGKPVWTDEGGWGNNFSVYENTTNASCGTVAAPLAGTACVDATQTANTTVNGVLVAPPAAWMMRYYFNALRNGLARIYYFVPGANAQGAMSTFNTPAGCTTGCTYVQMSQKFAWDSMYSWLVGSTLGTYQVVSGSQLKYTLTDASGHSAVIVWDTNTTSTTSCTIGGVTYPFYNTAFEGTYPSFSPGTQHACSGSVSVGPTPIFLNQGGLLAFSQTPFATNNTAACGGSPLPAYCNAAFTGMSNTSDAGAQTVVVNPAPGNVSTVDIHNLLPGGTKVIAHSTDWFTKTGSGDHTQTHYDSNDAATIAAQNADMIQRHFNARVTDYYGQFNVISDGAAQKIQSDLNARCAAPQNCPLEWAIVYDQGAITRDQGSRTGCTLNSTTDGTSAATTCLQNGITSDLCYANGQYFGQKAYWKMSPTTHLWATSTNPVVLLFPPGFTSSWNTAMSNIKAFITTNGWAATHCPTGQQGKNGGLVLIDSDTTNVAQAGYTGGSSWVGTTGWSITNQLLIDGPSGHYHEDLYNSCNANPGSACVGSAKKGFNDWPHPPFASWTQHRVTAQECGQTFLSNLAIANSTFTGSNLTVQLVTWNDYEEGSEIETGIDNCYRLGSGTISTNTLNWSASLTTNDNTYAPISAGQPTNGTADHWAIWYCGAAGQCHLAQDNIALATTSEDISLLVPAGSWTVYVQLVGKPNMWNQLSSGVSYTH